MNKLIYSLVLLFFNNHIHSCEIRTKLSSKLEMICQKKPTDYDCKMLRRIFFCAKNSSQGNGKLYCKAHNIHESIFDRNDHIHSMTRYINNLTSDIEPEEAVHIIDEAIQKLKKDSL